MTNWFTSDTHFGHENIIKFSKRPFNSIAHMDSVLIANMWELVKPEDDLWIVGDFAYGEQSNDPNYLNEIFGQLPGARKHLVIGNHDGPLTQALPWCSVSHLTEVRDGPHNQAHTLCHYPMITWNHSRRQALQLFGHVHENWRGTRNSVNVGVDVWSYKPVHFDDVARRAKGLPINKHWKDAEPRSA